MGQHRFFLALDDSCHRQFRSISAQTNFSKSRHVSLEWHIFARARACVCVCVCVRACMCMYACVYVRVCLWEYAVLSVRVCVQLCVCTCVGVFVHVLNRRSGGSPLKLPEAPCLQVGPCSCRKPQGTPHFDGCHFVFIFQLALDKPLPTKNSNLPLRQLRSCHVFAQPKTTWRTFCELSSSPPTSGGQGRTGGG